MKIKAWIVYLLCLFCFLGSCDDKDITTEPSDDVETSYSESVVVEQEEISEFEDILTEKEALEIEGSVVSSEETDPNQTLWPKDTDEEYSFEIHFMDVGEADAALILCDGAAMLIDGGNSDDSRLMYSYLEQRQINHLEYIICTHAHEDHVGGLAGALNYATVGKAYCSTAEFDSHAFESFQKYLERQGVSIEVPLAGETFLLGSAEVKILGPVCPSENLNNMSIVVWIQYGETSFLFAGDAEWEEEQDILWSDQELKSTVLKVGHHGSDTATSEAWLEAIGPEYAVISVGADNTYGHPHQSVLDRLQKARVPIYRTDELGHIICRSDGVKVVFETEKPREFVLDSFMTETESQSVSDRGSLPQEYVLNVNTRRFHWPYCSSVSQMKEKNRQEVSAMREELLEQGYVPCGNCNP